MDIYVHMRVEVNMMSDRELYVIKGGSFSFSATFLNAVSRFIDAALEAGRTFGTSLRMLFNGRKC